MFLIELLFLFTVGSSPEEGVKLAIRLQEEGRYAAAATLYDLLETHKPGKAEFYLNQGNAHFLAGNLPQAILAYRRAERNTFLSTNDVRANLADARGRVGGPPAAGSGEHWPPLASEAAVIGAILYYGAWILIASPTRRQRWRLIASLAFVGSLVLFAYFLHVHGTDATQPVAVVSADGVLLRKGNGAAYAAVEAHGAAVQLNRGAEARALAVRKNGWVQIKLHSGVVGWAPRGQLLLDRELDPN